ncbi:hypothetical protein [Paludisphaera rhizosphaerae]|uniref:hypothetical protein n=1 Tax=Paludisphaera rhizosphaerae TaxID=2711216 RepID=UPI0013EB755D|nr:hypothetical protein [Paludisphaera rhizosphaerae]
MSEKRHFYRMWYHAYTMQAGFEMRFQLQFPGCRELETVVAMDWDRIMKGEVKLTPTSRFFVHSASLHLLEPRVGDHVLAGGVIFQVIPDGELMRHVCAVCISDLRHYDGVEIVRRDGRPFHWPESEAA